MNEQAKRGKVVVDGGKKGNPNEEGKKTLRTLILAYEYMV